MSSGNIDIQSRFINALRTQPSHHKAEPRPPKAFLCPYCGHHGRVFRNAEQLLDHARTEHNTEFEGLASPQARAKLVQDAKKLDQFAEASANDGSTRLSSPDIAALSLDPAKERQASPQSGKKRRADFEFHARKEKVPSNVEVADPDYSRDIPFKTKTEKTRSRPHDIRLYNPKHGNKGVTAPHRSATEHSSGWSGDIDTNQTQMGSPNKQPRSNKLQPSHTQSRQPGLIELQRYDPRFPGLLLQPDSRPISQEQLASEVKSIYAGLTMVETKCIHVDRVQATAPQENKQLAPDHWQALIALHRTLLHEHHDFFLASQHPSASPALRRLAAKYTMPARMWKHGIHSFLELLRQRLPASLDYMLAFIYLSYQMMALLYETVPAFEDTWIECLGDLGRYRMAIEDEDIRDRETWASVARSWYSKAADKNPTVGRLYHHLAILARPNALQQMYYYGRSLTSVETFPSARESIMTLLGPVLNPDQIAYSNPSLVDTSFITIHAHIFTRNITERYKTAQADFLNHLDNHIGRVTAKWKEQGVYVAVANSAGWFDYGVEANTLRLVFELRAKQRRRLRLTEEQVQAELGQTQNGKPSITDHEIPSAIKALSMDKLFCEAVRLTNKTLSLVLRRIGDKNVLPHVHVLISFLATLASIEYVADVIDQAPWVDLVPFLNTLLKSEIQQDQSHGLVTLLAKPVFPVGVEKTGDRDELPLPEDYLIRGLIWSEEYFPEKWFEIENDEEERYLELASTAKRRAERVLRLGHQLSSFNRWLSYEKDTHTFSVVQA
ncbi:hypothetical protein EKO04_010308 [Ascochyta lentis]|uniref:DNA/RNA-binding domain-containing protein n=1 Tax=Ascochyta lentis TaxID=205686 RepID=A0A8H7IW00_9PLEO|nr:hypothetical protein EKO04_010308 [Ascochyta lentis]